MQGNASEYARQLAAYAQLINSADDVRRLKALAGELKGEKDVVVGNERERVRNRDAMEWIGSKRSWCRSSRRILGFPIF